MIAKTGWPPGMLQDDCRKLSQWLANRAGARRCVRDVCAAIAAKARSINSPSMRSRYGAA